MNTTACIFQLKITEKTSKNMFYTKFYKEHFIENKFIEKTCSPLTSYMYIQVDS